MVKSHFIKENKEERKVVEDDTTPTSHANLANSKSYEDVIAKIEKCENRDVADDFAKDFCYANNAPNRKRLIKDICAYHKEYQILVPFYCRILATLNKYFKFSIFVTRVH